MQKEDLENKDESDVNVGETENIEDVKSEETSEELDKLKLELENSKSQSEDLNNRLLRLQADFDNYKKRTLREQQNIRNSATEGLVVDILPALDNFDRALEVEYEENPKAFYEGIEMVHNQLLEILKSNGLEQIECLNKEFDYECHEAILHQESEEHDENIVIHEVEKGYKLKDKLIRPSKVIVSK